MLKSLILLAMLTGGGSHESSPPLTEIRFCQPELPAHVKHMNASFLVIYNFEVDDEGRATQISRVRDEFSDGAGVVECLKKWRLREVKPGSKTTVSWYWKHGVGWVEMTVLGENIRQRIVRSGDLSPYAGSPAISAPDAVDNKQLISIYAGPDEIFSSGFECGDLSGWAGTPLSCTLGTEVHYDIDVEESYVYGDKAGGVSRRDTAITFNGNTGETFTQGFTYTDLGDVESLDYPRCDFTRCTSDGDAGAQRSVGFTYTRGFLTAVPGYSPTIEYHPSGLLHRVYHTNAPRLVQEPDANGMARPARIFAKLDSNTLWSTGFYSFDGAGNVKSIGGSSFVYDRVSRLTSAKVSLGQQGTGSLLHRVESQRG